MDANVNKGATAERNKYPSDLPHWVSLWKAYIQSSRDSVRSGPLSGIRYQSSSRSRNAVWKLFHQSRSIRNDICICRLMERIKQHSDDDSIKFNIGGQLFETRRKTLRAHPGSLLYNRFCTDRYAGRFPAPDAGGSYFFDRSPRVFNVILDCYRWEIEPEADDPPLGVPLEGWLIELRFWQLTPETKQQI
jgi:hypothetical protein